MHELSIVESIVRIAEEQAKKFGSQRVSRIEMEIGKCSGIEMDAFDFAWTEAIKGSCLDTSVREVIMIEAKSKCSSCQTVFSVENIYDICPECGEICCDLVQGKELKISSIEIEEPVLSEKPMNYV